jgi:K+-sensing histidine kinase KdpD
MVPVLLAWTDRAIVVLTEYRARLAKSDVGALHEELVQRDDMVAKIQLLVRLRWAVHLLVPGVLLLLATQGLQLRTLKGAEIPADKMTLAYLTTLWPNFAIALTGLSINGGYRFLLKRRLSLRPIAHAQVWLDTVIFALVVFSTGGIMSPFTFLYTMPILAASLLLSFRASLAVAAFSTVALGAQAWVQFHEVLPAHKYFEHLLALVHKPSYVIAVVGLNGVLYFLIAATSGILTRTIKEHELRLARRANEATMLHEVSSTLQGVTELDEVLKSIMDILVKRLNIDRALMYLVNDEENALELKVIAFHPRHADAPRDEIKVRFNLAREAGLTAICAIEKRAYNVTDPLNHPLINRELAARIGLNPFAVAPMLARGKVIGVIGCDRKFQKGIITAEEAQTLTIAANQAGLTIQNAKLYQVSRAPKLEARPAAAAAKAEDPKP